MPCAGAKRPGRHRRHHTDRWHEEAAMFDFLMTGEQKELQEEVRDFTRSIDRQYLLDMDAEKIQYPKEILVEAAKRNLLGLRFPREYGGRGLGWVEECIAIEEVATLGIPCLLYTSPSP